MFDLQSQQTALLQQWLRNAPEWLRHAYHNDGITKRVLMESALAGDSERQMLLRLAGAMYESRNFWEGTATHHVRMAASISVKQPNGP